MAKTISIFLVFLFVFAAGITTVFAASEPTVAVSSVEGKPGDSVPVTITVADNPGIIALRIFVNYDSEKMQLTGVQDGTVFPAGRSTFNNCLDTNPYTMLWDDGTSKTNYTENGTLVTLTFSILDSAKEGISPITVTYDSKSTFDVNLQEVSFTMQNGSVTVSKEEKLYTTTFMVDGTAISTKQYHPGDAITKPADPTKEGYTFKGWTPSVPATMPASDQTFMAQFEKNPDPVGKVTGVSVSGMTIYYKDGGKLLPKVEMQGKTEYTVAYKVANSKILSIAEDGTVKTLHWGKTDVTVTVTDTGGNTLTDTCIIEVKCHIWQWIIIILLFGWIWY